MAGRGGQGPGCLCPRARPEPHWCQAGAGRAAGAQCSSCEEQVRGPQGTSVLTRLWRYRSHGGQRRGIEWAQLSVGPSAWLILTRKPQAAVWPLGVVPRSGAEETASFRRGRERGAGELSL